MKKGNILAFNLPSLGKTGTANEYSNSSYIGFVPSFSEQRGDFSLQNSFVVSAYVGYDDNKPMKNEKVRIFGASGALPIWIDVANEIVNNSLFQHTIDPVDFAFHTGDSISLPPPQGAVAVKVDSGSGLPITIDPDSEEAVKGTAILYSYGQWDGKFFKPQRFFNPVTTDIVDAESLENGEE